MFQDILNTAIVEPCPKPRFTEINEKFLGQIWRPYIKFLVGKLLGRNYDWVPRAQDSSIQLALSSETVRCCYLKCTQKSKLLEKSFSAWSGGKKIWYLYSHVLWDSNINHVVIVQPCIQRGKTGDVNNVDNGKKSSPCYLVSALIIPKRTGDKVKLTRCYHDNSFRVWVASYVYNWRRICNIVLQRDMWDETEAVDVRT